MNKNSKIFIAGATGMVGSAIVRKLHSMGYSNLLGSYHKRRLTEQDTLPVKMIELDIRKQALVNKFFKSEKPEYVFLAAAKVGGIHANIIYPAQFIYDNLSIQNNIIHAAYKNNIKRLLFLGSSCIYPQKTPQPLKEEYLLSGKLEPSNEPYAISKIAGIKMCESYNRQYGTRFVSVMPANIYGPNDNFDLKTSHVFPALIRKFHEARVSDKQEVIIWGTGKPRREFIHVDDVAEGCLFVMNLSDEKLRTTLIKNASPCFVNIGAGKDCTIKELSLMIKEQVGYEGSLVFDCSKPDGIMSKLLDVTKLEELGWESKISLSEGMKSTYNWYLENKN